MAITQNKPVNHRQSEYLRNFIRTFVGNPAAANGPRLAMARKLAAAGYLTANADRECTFRITRQGIDALIAHDKKLMNPENMRLLLMVSMHDRTGNPNGQTLVMMPGQLSAMIDSGIVVCTSRVRKTYAVAPDFLAMKQILEQSDISYLGTIPSL